INLAKGLPGLYHLTPGRLLLSAVSTKVGSLNASLGAAMKLGLAVSAAAVQGARVGVTAGNRLFQSSASGTQVSIHPLGVGSSCLRVPQEDIELTEVARAGGSANASVSLPEATWVKGLGVDIDAKGTMVVRAQFTNNFMNTGEPGLIVHGVEEPGLLGGGGYFGLNSTGGEEEIFPSDLVSHLGKRGIKLKRDSTLHMATCEGASAHLYGDFAGEAKVNVIGYGGQGQVWIKQDAFTNAVLGIYDDEKLTIPSKPRLYPWRDNLF
ncbi:hypothetical protein ACWKX9_26535, partial [Enterobacter asburiae]